MAEEFKPLFQRIRESKAMAGDQNLTASDLVEKRQLSSHMVEPRETPKGTRVIKQSDDEVILGVRYVLRFWWPFLPAALLAFTIVGAPAVGGIIGAVISDWQNNFIPVTIAVVFIGSVIATILAFQRTRGEVVIIAQPDKIKFGDKTYDRQHYGGMRMGYSVSTEDNALKNDFFDQSMGMSALRLSYGRWGEDLPYLVNKYHAPEIVIWMNEHINAVGAPAPRDNAPSEGRRQQSF